MAQSAHSSTALPGAGLYDARMRSAVLGVVRDRAGRPQVGALVELLNARYAVVARTFTDDHGRYTLPRLGSGLYEVKASAALLLPAIRPGLKLLGNTRATVNLTLSSLYQALDWLPAERRGPQTPSDDWDWTLRLSTNRPLLRVLPEETARLAAANGTYDLEGPVLIESGTITPRATRRGIVRQGPMRFGEGGAAQQIEWTRSSTEGRALRLVAETGETGRVGASAAYRQELSQDRSVMTMASFMECPNIRTAGASGLTQARVRSGSTVRFGDLAQIDAGAELQVARLGRESPVVGSHPFAVVSAHAGAQTISYRIAAAPSLADPSELDAAETNRGLSEADGRLQLEQGLHQELRIERRFGGWSGQLAAFHDRLAHPVVQGRLRGDEAAIDSRNVLYDPGTGMIAVSGEGYSHGGVMAMLHDQLSPDTWLTFRYAIGEAVTAPAPGRSFGTRTASQAMVAAGTRIAATGTAVRGSYRWQPVSTLTGVAPFESVPDAYLGFSLRQPLRVERVGMGRLEAILDVRNLLAEGYRPFLSDDGGTVYFAQAQRSIAGGISFSF